MGLPLHLVPADVAAHIVKECWALRIEMLMRWGPRPLACFAVGDLVRTNDPYYLQGKVVGGPFKTEKIAGYSISDSGYWLYQIKWEVNYRGEDLSRLNKDTDRYYRQNDLVLAPTTVSGGQASQQTPVNKQSVIQEAREFAQQEPLPASPIGLFIPFSGAFEERHGAEARKEMRRNFRDDATFAMAEELWRRLVEDLRAPAQSAVEASALTPGAGAHRRFEDVLTNMVYSQIIRDVDPDLVVSTGFAPDVLDGAGNPMPFSLVYSRLRYGAYADLEQRFRDLKDTPSSREALYTVVNKWLGRYDDELTQKQQATADLVQKRIAEIAAIRQRPVVKAQSDSKAPRKIGAVQAETYKYPALFELAQILRNQEGSILERKVKAVAPMRFKSYFSTLATIASNLGIEREALLNHVKRGDIEVLSTEAGYGRDEGLHGQRDAQIIEYAVHPGVESSQKAPARPIKKGDIVRYNKQSVHSHSRRGWRGTVQRVDGDMLYVDWRAADGDLRYRNEPTSEDDITRVT